MHASAVSGPWSLPDYTAVHSHTVTRLNRTLQYRLSHRYLIRYLSPTHESLHYGWRFLGLSLSTSGRRTLPPPLDALFQAKLQVNCLFFAADRLRNIHEGDDFLLSFWKGHELLVGVILQESSTDVRSANLRAPQKATAIQRRRARGGLRCFVMSCDEE